MKLYLCLAISGVCFWEAGCTFTTSSQAATPRAASAREPGFAPQPVVLASPGRVEGLTDTIEVGAGIDGVIAEVHVKEGQWVAKDQVLADIACPDLKASLNTAVAEEESLHQVKARLIRGSRDEERLASEQRTIAAKAVLDQATAHLKRTTELVKANAMARYLLDEAQRDFGVAEAKLREARRQEELVKAPALKEDIEKADADIRAAQSRENTIQQQLTKCTVKSPITGTILRVLLRKGEAFSTTMPRPLFTLSDLSGRRVRAEVDEKDVAKVLVGQKVWISSDATGSQKLRGKVQRLSPTMGRKRTVSGDPSEKADRDILEVIVELEEEANQLPLGLRVVVQFEDRRES